MIKYFKIIAPAMSGLDIEEIEVKVEFTGKLGEYKIIAINDIPVKLKGCADLTDLARKIESEGSLEEMIAEEMGWLHVWANREE